MTLQCLRLPLLTASFLLCAEFVSAQQPSQFTAADTSSPRDTLRSFIEACNGLHKVIQETRSIDRTSSDHRELTMQVLDCIDASELPAFAREQRTAEVAAALKEILDRVEIPAWDEIPDTSEIEAAGGYEKLSLWRIPGTRITIQRADAGPQKHEYLFSTGTVARSIEYYQDISHRPYRTGGPEISPNLYSWYMTAPGHPFLGSLVERLPQGMRFGRTLGLANWKWPGVILMVAIANLLMWWLYSLQLSAGKRVPPQKRLRYFATLAFPIAAVFIPLGFLEVIERYLTVRGTPLYIISFSAHLAAVLAAMVVVFAASTRIAESVIASPDIKSHGLDAQLIRITSKLVATLLMMILLISGGQYLGIPIATLLASAGIGGIALALGAQDTLKNIFATIALMADKPCRFGDRIKFKDYEGYVEDIGLRSTRLRLLDGHRVTIPNDMLACHDVENISNRERIRRSAEILIPLDTAYIKVERAVEIIREKLQDHEGMDPEFPPRVFFDEFGPEAFSIRFMYWYAPPDLWAFRAFGEKLNLEIFRAFEAEGIQFSLPLRHSYWKQDAKQGPLDVRLSHDESTSTKSGS